MALARVKFDPETLTFEVHRPTGVSGCEVETWTINPDDHTVEVRYCVDGEPRTEVRVPDDETVEELLRMAREVNNYIAVLAVGILDPAKALNEFIDVRYVIRLDDKGEIVLDAVEILPCMGVIGCVWYRVDGDPKIREFKRVEELFLDAVEELLNEIL